MRDVQLSGATVAKYPVIINTTDAPPIRFPPYRASSPELIKQESKEIDKKQQAIVIRPVATYDLPDE